MKFISFLHCSSRWESFVCSSWSTFEYKSSRCWSSFLWSSRWLSSIFRYCSFWFWIWLAKIFSTWKETRFDYSMDHGFLGNLSRTFSRVCLCFNRSSHNWNVKSLICSYKCSIWVSIACGREKGLYEERKPLFEGRLKTPSHYSDWSLQRVNSRRISENSFRVVNVDVDAVSDSRLSFFDWLDPRWSR